MKKLSALILAIIMVISTVACSGSEKTPTPTDIITTPTAETTAPETTGTQTTPETSATPTAAQSETPTPTPTPSSEEIMTEEKLGVFPVGQYTISIPGVGYLVHSDADTCVNLTVSENATENNTYAIVYQTLGENPSYVLCPGDDTYRVVGLNNLTYITSSSTNTVSSNYRSLYTNINGTTKTTQDNNYTMRWYFEKNEDGTYKILLRNTVNFDESTPKYYLYYEDGSLTVRRDTENKSTDFNVEMTERGSNQFLQYISYGGRIALRLPPDMKKNKNIITNDKKISEFTDERGQKFADDLERAYWFFYELTNYIPYENIIVKAYANTTYMAYVTGSYNTITASYSKAANDFGPAQRWFYDDVIEMVKRGSDVNDWNFGCLHEMGHMFDWNQGWKFETECQTDFKLAYVLYKGNAVAAPSECSPLQYYGYDNIEEIYASLGGMNSATPWTNKEVSKDSYNIYGHAYRLIMIQKAIGSWDPVVELFHWYKTNETLSASDSDYVKIPTKNYEKFELFISKLSEFSGVDCRALYQGNEYAIVMAKCGYVAPTED